MGGGGFFPGNFMFSVVPVIIVIGFVVVIGMMVMNGARYMRNARSPRESVFARVVAKRMQVTSHTHQQPGGAGGSHPVSNSRTYYYITLEFDNGERREYLDVRNLYGVIVEGDSGYAAIQGDWIVAFERQTS